MNAKDFDKIVASRMDWCEQTLLAKGEEYSREGDRLWNFKSAGRKRNKHPAEALLDMKVKHDVSVDDIVDGLAKGIIPPKELVAEKIGDSINYLYLLEGLIEEARQEQKDFEKDYSFVSGHELDAVNDLEKNVECNQCKTLWPINSEQGRAVFATGICIVCQANNEKIERGKDLEPISIGQEVYILKDPTKVHIIPDKSSRSWNEPKIIPNNQE